MFVIEILFKNLHANPDYVLVNFLNFEISYKETAELYVKELFADKEVIVVTKKIGRSFQVRRIKKKDEVIEDSVQDTNYKIEYDFGTIHIYSLDIDLTLSPKLHDRSIVDVLHIASTPLKNFPVLNLSGKEEGQVSIGTLNEINIGRAEFNDIRLKAPESSANHAKIIIDENRLFVEDLGSTNGTFIENNLGNKQISGKVSATYAETITICRDIHLEVLSSKEDFSKVKKTDFFQKFVVQEARYYPAICSNSSIARPARLEIKRGKSYVVGRDPHSDFWLGAPYISRKHCEVVQEASGDVLVVDSSTNGTKYSKGLLKNGERIFLEKQLEVFSLGASINFAICFNEEQENSYRELNGRDESREVLSLNSNSINNSEFNYKNERIDLLSDSSGDTQKRKIVDVAKYGNETLGKGKIAKKIKFEELQYSDSRMRKPTSAISAKDSNLLNIREEVEESVLRLTAKKFIRSRKELILLCIMFIVLLGIVIFIASVVVSFFH